MRLPPIYPLFFLCWLACFQIQAQVASPFNIVGPKASITQILSENVRYPSEGLQTQKKGQVLFSIKINEAGMFDSLIILESSDEIFQAEALRALGYLESNWYPGLLEEKPRSRSYLLFFKFDAFLNERNPSELRDHAKNLIRKEKYDKALKLLNELLAENPYVAETFELRWEVYTNLGEVENAQKDYLRAKYLKKEFLSSVEIFAIGRTRSGVPISF